ncbi:mitochondrial ribosomal protein L27-domain-containing protein [Catenaria anguillulae PL171]|uniref:Mitochondrial ribosomal protein L27-domain-containing protein n=1 Tax=Catenaria anguillulae PL171 TaxID=765915 RepID=A0A1Y2HU80_9FUNG|nr:mitochondrial ribosomal protein L27-domain-containing protein [Catenaria anguillulae PL171]
MTLRSNLLTHLARGASRKPLTPKGGNKNYYKGTGSGAMGSFVNGTSHYRIDPTKVRQLVVPDLQDFKLKAYVSWSVHKDNYTVTKQDYLDAAEKSRARV